MSTSSAGLKSLLRQAMTRSMALLKKHRRWLQYGSSGAILLFLGLYIYRNAQELAGYELSVNLPSLAAASALALFVHFLTPLTWGLILWLCLDSRLQWRETLKVWYLSQISKYVPGSVWNYVSRVVLCNQRDISSPKAVLSMVLEIVLILLAQTLTVLLSLPFWLEGQQNLLWVLLILPIGLIFLQPRVFNGILKFIARRSGLGEPPLVVLELRQVGSILAIYTFGAIVVGIEFYFFANSFYPLPLKYIPAMTGIISLSMIIGFLAPIAPYGLGVREGILTVLLSQFMPAPVAAIISLASRLWLTAIELVGLGISLVLKPSFRPIPPNNPEGLSPPEAD